MEAKQVFILSYPRSGTNWTRYIIQHIYPENIVGEAGNLNFIHHHLVEIMPDPEEFPLVFCLRNYRECVIRNTRKDHCTPVIDNRELTWEQIIDIDRDKITSDPGGTMSNYMRNIEIYDQWPGKKHLVRYEDMVEDPVSTITELAWFLEVLPGEFLVDIDKHIESSLEFYAGYQGTYTEGKSTRFHQYLVSEDVRHLLDKKIESFNPALYEKYLSQYATD